MHSQGRVLSAPPLNPPMTAVKFKSQILKESFRTFSYGVTRHISVPRQWNGGDIANPNESYGIELLCEYFPFSKTFL